MSGQKTGSLGVYKETNEKSAVNHRPISDHRNGMVISHRADRENNELPPLNVLGLSLLQRGGSSLCTDEKNNERPCLKVLEVNLQNGQGLSPRSSAFFARAIQNSTPCDKLENVWSSTRSKTHSYNSRSTVTFILGLFFGIRDIEYSVISSKAINIYDMIFHSTTFNVVGDSQNGKQQPISASSNGHSIHPGGNTDRRDLYRDSIQNGREYLQGLPHHRIHPRYSFNSKRCESRADFIRIRNGALCPKMSVQPSTYGVISHGNESNVGRCQVDRGKDSGRKGTYITREDVGRIFLQPRRLHNGRDRGQVPKICGRSRRVALIPEAR